MKTKKDELELEANRAILRDLQEVLNKHAIKYMSTDSFMDVNKALDKLVIREQHARLLNHIGVQA